MNFFGIGLPEMILILVVALLVFGPKKLPEIGKSLGKALRSFQDASRDFQDEFKRQAAALESDVPPTASLPAQASEPAAIPPTIESTDTVEAAIEAEVVSDADVATMTKPLASAESTEPSA